MARARRLLRAVSLVAALAVGALLAAGGVGAGVVLYTEAGARWVLETAVAEYDALIPGHASVEAITGTLWAGPGLRGLVLRDRSGAALVTARALDLRWALAGPLLGQPALLQVRLDGAAVHLRPDGPAGNPFLDLAPPPGPDEPAPPEPPDPDHVGPDLPLGVLVGLQVRDLQLVTHAADDSRQERVGGLHLTLAALARGQQARLRLGGVRLRLPGVLPPDGGDLEVHDLALGLRWRDPEVRLTGLRLRTSAGRVDLGPGTVHVLSQRADLALAAAVDRDLARRLSGLPLATDPTLQARLRGTPARLALAAQIGVDGATLQLAVGGAVHPAPDLGVTARLRDLDPARLGSHPPGRIGLDIRAQAQGKGWAAPRVRGELRCHACRLDTLGALELTATGGYSGDTVTADLDLTSGFGDARAEVELRLPGALFADWSLDLPDLERIGDLLAVDGLGGSVEGAGQCAGTTALPRCSGLLDLRQIRAPGDVRLGRADLDVVVEPRGATIGLEAALDGRDLQAGPLRVDRLDLEAAGTPAEITLALSARHDAADRVDVGATVHPGPPLEIDLARLEGAWQGWHAGLNRPARIALAGARVTVDGLDLDFEGARLSADGEWNPRGRSDLSLAVQGLALAPLQRLTGDLALPVPWPAGRLDLTVGLQGRARAPSLTADLTTTGLTLGELRLGDLQLEAGLAEGRVRADLRVQQGPEPLVHLTAAAPLALDLVRGAARWDEAGEHDLTLALRGLDTQRLAPLVTLPRGLAAVADADLQGRGTRQAFELQLDASGEAAVPEVGRIPFDLAVRARPGNQRVELDLGPGGPVRLRSQVTARADVERALAGGLDPLRTPFEAELAIDDLDLEELPPLLAAPLASLAPRGHLDLQATARGTAAAPRVLARVLGHELALDADPVGELDLEIVFADDRVDLGLGLAGPGQQRLHLSAAAPVLLDAAAGRVEWQADEPHELDLVLRGLDATWPRRLRAWPEELGITLAADVSGRGTLDTLELDADSWCVLDPGAGEPLILQAELDLASGEQTVRARIEQAGRAALVLDARTGVPLAAAVAGELNPEAVPLALDLAIPGLDLALLAPLLRGPVARPRGTLKLDAHARGTLGAPQLSGTLALHDGAATVAAIGQRLEGIALNLRLDGSRVSLDNLTVSSGEGGLTGTGEATLGPGGDLDATTSLQLDRFGLKGRGLPPTSLTARIETTVRGRPAGLDVAVVLRRPSLELISLKARQPASIPANPHIVFVDAEAEAEPPARESPAAPPTPLNLTVDLADPFLVTGPQADLALGGKVEVEVAEAVAVRGAFDIKRGTFELLGMRFTVEDGTVTLPESGDVDPYLEIVAGTPVADVEVTATIRGRASRPELLLTSQPPLTQHQILTLLVTGAREADPEAQQEVQGKAANLLLAFRNPELERQVFGRLGIDRVGISFGDSVNQPILTVGKRLTRDIYVETAYQHNAPEDVNRAQVRIELQLAPRWFLETFYGDANVGGLDLFWRRSFVADPAEEE